MSLEYTKQMTEKDANKSIKQAVLNNYAKALQTMAR